MLGIVAPIQPTIHPGPVPPAKRPGAIAFDHVRSRASASWCHSRLGAILVRRLLADFAPV
jgi:hypothetical protein